MKRQPLLIDQLLASKDWQETYDRSFRERVIEGLYMAKRFVLDQQAAEYIGQMMRKMPRIIADAQDFAIPPFQRMWIEYPARTLFKAVTGAESSADSDVTVGYLFDGPLVRVAMLGEKPSGPPGVMPIEYVMNRPFTVREEMRLAEKLGFSRALLDVFYWGDSFKYLREEMQEKLHSTDFLEQDEARKLTDEDLRFVTGQLDGAESARQALRALRATHSFRLVPTPNRAVSDRDIWDFVSEGSAGDLRNIIGILLFLNRTQDIQYVRDVGFAGAMVNRKPTRLLPHKVISLKVDPMPRLKRLCVGEGITRRLHDVRGHFCHNEVARTSGCQHPDWEEFKPLHWRCPQCRGVRWWRKEHHRGKLERGVVSASYAVTR